MVYGVVKLKYCFDLRWQSGNSFLRTIRYQKITAIQAERENIFIILRLAFFIPLPNKCPVTRFQLGKSRFPDHGRRLKQFVLHKESFSKLKKQAFFQDVNPSSAVILVHMFIFNDLQRKLAVFLHYILCNFRAFRQM